MTPSATAASCRAASCANRWPISAAPPTSSSRSRSGAPDPALVALIRRHNPTAEIIPCAHRARELVEVDGPGRLPLEALRGKRVAAFSGIATPERFEETLAAEGAVLVANRRFLDHHAFNDEDLDEVLEQALRAHAEMIVTTEKDAVRLLARFRPPMPLYYVRLEVEVLGEGDGFNAAVERICFGSTRPASLTPVSPLRAAWRPGRRKPSSVWRPAVPWRRPSGRGKSRGSPPPCGG